MHIPVISLGVHTVVKTTLHLLDILFVERKDFCMEVFSRCYLAFLGAFKVWIC